MTVVVVIDAGTSSVRAAVIDQHGVMIRESSHDTPPISPSPGLVEFDPIVLRDTAMRAVTEVIDGIGPIGAVGITNQRGSVVVWDRATGAPIGPGIGWQDLRTANECAELARNGLRVSPNQSPTKAKWLWDQADMDRTRDLCVGTIDSWLAWTLSGGSAHVTDASNAYASGLMSVEGGAWDETVASAMRIPMRALPTIVDSIGSLEVATELPGRPRITGIAGDQQASMFGQGCLNPGDIKATFGTGGSLNACLSTIRPKPRRGTFPIIVRRQLGVVTWGTEAIVLTAGSCVDWLCDELGVIDSPSDAERIAAACETTSDVWFVPALAGLGSPYWDLEARGTLLGLTRGTGRPQIVRAVLEGVAHRGADLLDAILAETAMKELCDHRATVDHLRVDGGMSANSVFVQALADATRRTIQLAPHIEATAIGIGLMAAVGADLIDMEMAAAPRPFRDTIEPAGDACRIRWREAVSRATRH